MLDLDTIQARADEARLRPTTVPGYLVTKAEIAAVVASAEDVPALVAELRAARDVCEALERWGGIPGMYFGDTPETGSEVGNRLGYWQHIVGRGGEDFTYDTTLRQVER